ncbi:hypothetical protein BH23GEM10_BH23GEM10_16130 [soil metagenome]
MRALLTAVLILAVAMPAAAQHAGHGSSDSHHAGGVFPDGWQGRLDRDSEQLTNVRFMTMGDAFHIITGPHVILWNPAQTASAQFRASGTFRQTRAPERLEGFGLVVGGRDLDAPGQDYLYFLVRHDGRFMIRHRAGTEVHTLVNWTEHAAINRAGEATAASNALSIEARAGAVRFLVNGTVVQTFERVPMLNTDGVVGLRIGHHVDVHVEDLSVEPISGL